MNETILTTIIGFFSTIVGYIVGSRKQQADTDRLVLDNVRGILDIYNSTINDLKNEINELKTKINEYEKMVDNMSVELNTLRKQLEKRSVKS